jgi:5-formyltetrahydrofolate cyclo-ligase
MKNSKTPYRKTLQSLLDGLTGDALSHISQTIFKTVCSSVEWQSASIILAYLSIEQEISLDELIQHSLQAGKRVYAPRIKGKIMEFHQIQNLDTTLFKKNRWDIREPREEAPIFDHETKEKTLILVPGLGFTEEGSRMGRGGGFYDRYLENAERNPHLITMGICWEDVLMKDLPVEDHDRKMQMVCCADRLIRTQSLN